MISYGMVSIDELEKLGEAEVRIILAKGGLGDPGSRTNASVQEWLHIKELKRQEAFNDKQEAREAENLSKADDNLTIQRQIRNMTIVVLIITAITLIVSMFPPLYKVFKSPLPASNIQPHQEHNQPAQIKGRKNRWKGGSEVE
jgi:hypothetical protein